ncbi:MAG: hypothetical protein ABIY55_08095, partial [Kofleriaceae bacterium]
MLYQRATDEVWIRLVLPTAKAYCASPRAPSRPRQKCQRQSRRCPRGVHDAEARARRPRREEAGRRPASTSPSTSPAAQGFAYEYGDGGVARRLHRPYRLPTAISSL